jgi:hypothetical protein
LSLASLVAVRSVLAPVTAERLLVPPSVGVGPVGTGSPLVRPARTLRPLPSARIPRGTSVATLAVRTSIALPGERTLAPTLVAEPLAARLPGRPLGPPLVAMGSFGAALPPGRPAVARRTRIVEGSLPAPNRT